MEHDCAVDLAFTGPAFGDVGDPRPKGFATFELALHEIRRTGLVGDLAVAGPARQTCESVASH